MGYITSNLVPGETIIYRARVHWLIFGWAILFAFLTLLTLCGSLGAGWFLFSLIGTLIFGVPAFVNYRTSEFGLTDKRVIMKTGFIRRHSIEVMLSKIEGVQVEQGPMGRLLNYGTVTVTGTGGTRDPFHRIARPLEFRKRVQNQIAADTWQTGPFPALPPPPIQVPGARPG